MWYQKWRNTLTGYGYPHIVLHWLSAVTVFGLFGLGIYMVDVDYYNPWYNRGPALHISIGLLLVLILVLRLCWRLLMGVPKSVDTGQGRHHWERLVNAFHWLLYALLFAPLASGYLLASEDGFPLPVFDWFSVPAYPIDQTDLLSEIHDMGAWGLMAMITLHFLAALKHHFVDKDSTLKRMLWPH